MRTCRQRFALLSLALLCVGCINGNVRSFVRYEPKEDTFWFLDIYSNLRATSGADQDHLASLWKRRDAILIKPLRWLYLTADGSWELHLFSQEAIERIGKHQYRTIELDTAPAKEPAIETSGLDLAAIRVLPGQFYINEYGTLSCYHQMAVPGATVDAVLERIRPLLAKLFVKLADGEIQLAKKGARRATWEETRRAIVEQLRAADTPPIAPKSEPKAEPQKRDDPGTLLPLEAESIRLLKNAVADRSVKLRRTGSVITLVVPVTKNDAAEAAATLDLLKNTIAQRIKAGQKVPEGLAGLLDAVQIRFAEDGGLEFSTDLVKLARIANRSDNPQPDQKKDGYKKTIEAMRARGIEVKENFSIKGLIDEYTN